MGANGTLTDSTFMSNSAEWGGAIHIGSSAPNFTLTHSALISNVAHVGGGGIACGASNTTLSDCNFTGNTAVNGDNVWWRWTITDFLNKYTQINDYDYVFIQNGVGTPNNTIVLNKKGITIHGEGDVIFDAKGGNLHFEVTGDNILIENLTFRNFNLNKNNADRYLNFKEAFVL